MELIYSLSHWTISGFWKQLSRMASSKLGMVFDSVVTNILICSISSSSLMDSFYAKGPPLSFSLITSSRMLSEEVFFFFNV
jgi:hypothetical protein